LRRAGDLIEVWCYQLRRSVTDRTIRQMIADGRINGYRSGSRLVRVDLNEVDAAMRPFGGDAA